MSSYVHQVSTNSVDSVTNVAGQVLPPLPPELETKILHYIPTLHLVRACMRVSKSWYLFLKDPVFWISKMKEHHNFNPGLSSLDNVQWPKLCFYTVDEPNLLKSFNSEGQLCLKPYWNTTSTHWSRFKTGIRDRDIRWDRGGGNAWSMEEWIDKNKPEDEAVLKANGGSCQNYVTSHDWCCREQVIELAAIGLTNTVMDTIRPAITVSEWFCARWDCASEFCIRVELLSGDKQVVAYFEDSQKTDQWEGGRLGWRLKEHTFADYGEGVRYFRFADGGKDSQYWAGHYGSKMAAASARIKF